MRRAQVEQRPPILLPLTATLSVLAGCATPSAPEVIVIERARYSEAFDAAVDALREVGMETALRDRDGGVIESQPHRAGGLGEPWRTDNSGLGQAAENTVATRRRRARLEFIATDFVPPEPNLGALLLGPDLDSVAGRAAAPLDGPGGPIELRAWVYLEQSFTPGVRRFPWTFRLTTISIDPQEPIDFNEGVVEYGYWTPIGRDEAYERRLMAEVERKLEQHQVPRGAG